MKKRIRKVSAYLQIYLITLAIFSFSFLVSQTSFVGAQDSEQIFKVTRGSSTPGQSTPSASILGTKTGTKELYRLTTGTAKIESLKPIELPSGLTIDVNGEFVHLRELQSGSFELATTQQGGTVYQQLTSEQATKLQEVLSAQGIDLTKRHTYKFFGATITGGWAHLLQGASWALLAAGAVQLIGNIAGLEQEQTNAASIAAAAGIMSYKGLLSLGPSGFGKLAANNLLITGAPFVGVAVAAVVFIALYEKESKKVARFQCLPWEPPTGGRDCERCNEDPFRPCSEYRCRSLGQSCELVNPGTNEEKCVWVNPRDTTSPIITPFEEVLTEGHRYTNHDSRPTNLGTKIIKTQGAGGCIAPFTPLVFGLTTNEPSQCKIDYEHTESFDEMQFFIGQSNLFREEHQEQVRLPSPDSLEAENITINGGGQYDFYVRCQDRNGNHNLDEFVFSFCVDPTPDTTPPRVEVTSISPGSPVSFGTNEIEIQAFINEPAECKWSINDQDYENMENNFECATRIVEQNSQQLYPCSTTLTGIQDRAANPYFIRCRDQPNKPINERNTMSQSFNLTLFGTQELTILSASPNNEIVAGSTTSVPVEIKVETSNGASEGKSVCYLSTSGNEGSYTPFFETDNFEHKQTLQLQSGVYAQFIRCIDSGGNSAETNISFTVLTDDLPPIITRAYKEGFDTLRIVTDEPADCAYSLNDCNFVFEEGLPFSHSSPDEETISFAEWQTNLVYYVKCQDKFGNQPAPNQCSIIASASNVF